MPALTAVSNNNRDPRTRQCNSKSSKPTTVKKTKTKTQTKEQSSSEESEFSGSSSSEAYDRT